MILMMRRGMMYRQGDILLVPMPWDKIYTLSQDIVLRYFGRVADVVVEETKIELLKIMRL